MEMGLVLSSYSLSKQLVVRDSVAAQMQMYWPSVTPCQRYSTHDSNEVTDAPVCTRKRPKLHALYSSEAWQAPSGANVDESIRKEPSTTAKPLGTHACSVARR